MTTATAIVVEQIESQQRKTKYGLKDVYSFKASGQWYQTGFKRHGLNVGDTVSLDFTTDTYGNQVDMGSIKRTGAAPTTAGTGSTGASAPAGRTQSVPYSSGKGVFPIPALDGQRSIVRQNALTNARELYCESLALPAIGTVVIGNLNQAAAEIIRIAKVFEGYTAGDTDLHEVEDELAAEAKARK